MGLVGNTQLNKYCSCIYAIDEIGHGQVNECWQVECRHRYKHDFRRAWCLVGLGMRSGSGI